MAAPILKLTMDDKGNHGYDIPGDTVSSMRKENDLKLIVHEALTQPGIALSHYKDSRFDELKVTKTWQLST